jgi:23S rRNA pseudouridine2605 synthase
MKSVKIKTVRADKYFASLGFSSRRNIEKYLKHNKVTVNEVQISSPGERFNPKNATIRINGKEVEKPKRVYFILNKPKGVVTTVSDEFGRKNVLSIIKTKERVFPIGRLDKETHGLLLLTNDGELTNMLIHPKYHIPKVYQLTIKGQIFPPQIEKLEKGIVLDDGKTKPAHVQIRQRKKDVTIFDITLFEGRKRQIRHMCEKLNLTLIDLVRIQFGPLKLENLKDGEYRSLTSKEMETLRKSIKTVAFKNSPTLQKKIKKI